MAIYLRNYFNWPMSRLAFKVSFRCQESDWKRSSPFTISGSQTHTELTTCHYAAKLTNQNDPKDPYSNHALASIYPVAHSTSGLGLVLTSSEVGGNCVTTVHPSPRGESLQGKYKNALRPRMY